MTRNCTAKVADVGFKRQLFLHATLPLAAIGIILLALGVYGAWRVHRLHERSAEIVAQNLTGIRDAEQLRAATQELRYRLKRFAGTGDEQQLEKVSSMLPEVKEQRGKIRSRSPNADAERAVGQIDTGLNEFAAVFSKLRDKPDAEVQREEAPALADSSIVENVLAALDEYIALTDEQVQRSSRRNKAIADELMFGLILLGTCGGVAGLFSGYVIARRLSRMIVEVGISLRDVAGKLDQAIDPVALPARPRGQDRVQDLEVVLHIISQRVSTMVQRLQSSEREALRAEQLAAMGQLTAGLAHEVRNPLTSIKTIVQLARTPTDLTPQDLRVLDEEVARLEQSVQMFLDYARPAQPNKSEAALCEVLDQPVAVVSRRAARQGIDFQFEPPPLAVRATVDAVQIRQVVLNLLLNALEATPAGGAVRLTASVVRVENANDPEVAVEQPGAPCLSANGVCIRVTDSGSGLPEHLGRRIFDPFVSTKDTGTGLGLSICRRIVEDHGGRIEAENHAQGGAVLAVYLPIACTTPTLNSNTDSERASETAEDVPTEGGPVLGGAVT